MSPGELVVLVCEARGEGFRAVDEVVLLALASRAKVGPVTPELLAVLRRDLLLLSRPAAVSGDGEADCELVLDGVDDAESWIDLFDRLDGQVVS